MKIDMFKILEPKEGIKSGVRLSGHFTIRVYDNKENMKLISESECHNIITNEGLDHILDVVLHGTTPVSPWYCSIFESNSTPGSGWTYDTYADSDVTEWNAGYDESTRPEYEEAAASSQSTTNSANKATFTANATKTLYGAALVSVNTKGDHGAGTLLCAGTFTASQPVISGNVVELTYTITAADDAA